MSAGLPRTEPGTPPHTGNPTPIAHILKVTPIDTTRLIIVRCPFPDCRRRHFHGWPYGDAEIGHRRADCTRGGYWIEAPAS
jgi:hypothetical protein